MRARDHDVCYVPARLEARVCVGAHQREGDGHVHAPQVEMQRHLQAHETSDAIPAIYLRPPLHPAHRTLFPPFHEL